MDETRKYTHNQILTDEDFLVIKRAIKGKKDTRDFKQIPSGLFIVFVAMAFTSYVTKDLGAMIIQIIGAIICMIGVFFVNYIDRNGVLLYKLMFAKCNMKQIIFYQEFMECHNDLEMVIILYEKINKIYDSKNMIIVKLNEQEQAYLFITKKGLNKDLYEFLQLRFNKKWVDTEKLNDFHL